tara:strand:- start:183 stop:329 length:147 start_codon:yes stop_codon:yes gene_type:complete
MIKTLAIAFGELEISSTMFVFLIGLTLFIFLAVILSSIKLVQGAIDEE